ncbi:hypothetical protein SLH46_11765 [Draconibacterium sp. IB214405]|uniref:hypothetical protein n=1 Tax=Draconibacterium sp. IB214405 TaxID=3097352 RepID=UPI002A110984|nr:hypothetical protein [Draconibacterium sp. IB214405]MDX8339865.1 hypothetical protein [Draconibacterium sp. IB214405]
MIERIIVTGEQDHRHYLLHEELAHSWEKFSVDLNGKISGIVNRHILEFKLNFQRGNKEIVIIGKRQFDSHYSSPLDKHFAINTSSKIEVHKIKSQYEKWEIKKKDKFDLIRRLFQTAKTLSYDKHYSISSSAQLNERWIMPPELFEYLKNEIEIRTIAFKDEVLKIEYDNLLDTNKTLEILDVILKKYSA